MSRHVPRHVALAPAVARPRSARRTVRRVLLPCALAVALPASAQDWESLNPGAGGQVQDVVPDPARAERAFVLSDVEGLYRTEDGGESWIYSSAGLAGTNALALAPDPSNPSRFYLGTTVGLHVSDDGGLSWRLQRDTGRAARPELLTRTGAEPELAVGDVVVDAGSGWRRVLAGVGNERDSTLERGAVLRSVDGGASFEAVRFGDASSADASVLQLALDPGGDAAYAATAGNGLWRGEDFGAPGRWTRTSSPAGLRRPRHRGGDGPGRHALRRVRTRGRRRHGAAREPRRRLELDIARRPRPAGGRRPRVPRARRRPALGRLPPCAAERAVERARRAVAGLDRLVGRRAVGDVGAGVLVRHARLGPLRDGLGGRHLRHAAREVAGQRGRRAGRAHVPARPLRRPARLRRGEHRERAVGRSDRSVEPRARALDLPRGRHRHVRRPARPRERRLHRHRARPVRAGTRLRRVPGTGRVRDPGRRVPVRRARRRARARLLPAPAGQPRRQRVRERPGARPERPYDAVGRERERAAARHARRPGRRAPRRPAVDVDAGARLGPAHDLRRVGAGRAHRRRGGGDRRRRVGSVSLRRPGRELAARLDGRRADGPARPDPTFDFTDEDPTIFAVAGRGDRVWTTVQTFAPSNLGHGVYEITLPGASAYGARDVTGDLPFPKSFRTEIVEDPVSGEVQLYMASWGAGTWRLPVAP